MSGASPLRLHLDGLWTWDSEGYLLQSNEPEPEPAPLLYVGRHGGEYLVRTGAQLSPVVRAALLRLPSETAYTDRGRVLGLLAEGAQCTRIESGPVYYADRHLPEGGHPHARLLDAGDYSLLERYDPGHADSYLRRAPVAAVVIEGEIRALCLSARSTPAAAEAGVETTPAWRRHGYGRQVVLAWVRAVQALGKVALYSTSWDNVASQAVARSLDLRLCGEDLSFY